MRLEGKVAVVTGAARGLGRAIALRLGGEGAAIVVADLLADRAQASAEEMRQMGIDAIALAGDVGDPSFADAMIGEAKERFGRLDILINNAGIAPNRLFLEQTLEEWNGVIRTNLTGTFLCSKAAVPVMREGGSGCIVNMASISGQRGATGRGAYGVSKAGIIQLTKIMAVECADLHIRVNAIAPGPVRTDMTDHSSGTVASYLSRIPMNAYGSMDAVAAAALFLATDESSYTTGHVLNVDGGFEAAGLMFEKDELHDAG
jgi:3-oxoacyl-[acyl-carrier protein] reductase